MLFRSANFHLSEQVTHAGSDQVFNWDSKTPGVVVLGAQISETYPELASASATIDWVHEAQTYMDITVNGRGRGFFTNGEASVEHC